jgi:hypothetical protein
MSFTDRPSTDRSRLASILAAVLIEDNIARSSEGERATGLEPATSSLEGWRSTN